MRLRVILLIGFTGLALFALAADDPPPDIQVDTTDGRTITGQLLNPTIRLKTEHGTLDVDAHKIQRMTFSPGDAAGGHDMIEFADDTHVRGAVLTRPIQVETSSGVESLDPDNVREIKAQRKHDRSLWAIILG